MNTTHTDIHDHDRATGLGGSADLDNIRSVLERPIETAALHYLHGRIRNPGSSRYSAVAFWPRQNSPLANLKRDQQDKLQSTAFQAYVNRAGRSNLLLTLLEEFADHARGEDRGVISIKFENDVDVAIRAEHGSSQGNHLVDICLAEAAVWSLCPENLLGEFVEYVVKSIGFVKSGMPAVPDAALEQQFTYARYKTMVKLEGDNLESLKDTLRSLEVEATPQKIMQLLHGLQGSLLFLLASSGSDLLKSNGVQVYWRNVDTFDRFDSEAEKSSADRIRSMLMIAPVGQQDVLSKISALNTTLDQLRGVVAPSLDRPAPDRRKTHLKHPKYQGVLKDDALAKQVDRVFEIDKYSARALIITQFLMRLLEQVGAAKHEGAPLDFWFAVGNLTEIVDSSCVTVLHFDKMRENEAQRGAADDQWEAAVGSLAIPLHGTENDYELRLDLAARILVSEHFPWFEAGRYALFYDVAGSAMDVEGGVVPSGLVKVEGSSWDAYAKSCFSDRPETALPPHILVFQRGAERFGGVVTARRSRRAGRSDVNLFARLYKDGFQKMGDDSRLNDVKMLLVEGGIPQQVASGIAGMVIRLAENPSRGGILVMLEEGAEPGFASMGIPWDFSGLGEGHWEDLEALISHDGATLLEPDGDSVRWSFRKLLSADALRPDEKPRIRRLLEAKAREAGPSNPLGGAGSRRWSAALTAFCPGVNSVLVISQDGDVVHWQRHRGQHDIIGAAVRKLPLGAGLTKAVLIEEKGE